jgi:hypothetical protein
LPIRSLTHRILPRLTISRSHQSGHSIEAGWRLTRLTISRRQLSETQLVGLFSTTSVSHMEEELLKMQPIPVTRSFLHKKSSPE